MVSRVVLLSLPEKQVRAHCAENDVGLSTIEALRDGGVRLVCMSARGAELIREKLKKHLIQGDVVRERYRPRTPLW
jgi:hypothetical protein